jgi:hypothetical protein
MPQTESATPVRTPYRARLHHMECCNCKHGCNCQFMGWPNEGYCEFLVGYEVAEGSYGEVDLRGVRFVVACKYPGAIHEGGGTVVLFVDERATPEQVEAVATILSGQAGGMPWEALAGTIEKLEGPIRAPIEMKVDGARSWYRVPDVLEVRMEPMKDVVSGKDKEVHIVYPQGGFFWDDGNICTTGTMRIDHDAVSFEHPGRYSAYAVCNWSNQA